MKSTPIFAALIFLVVFAIQGNSRVITRSDSTWSLYVAQSILTEGNTNLDEYRELIEQRDKFGVRIKRGHFYNYFPIGVSLVALPFVYGYDRAPKLAAALLPGIEYSPDKNNALAVGRPLERAIASLCVALAALFLFLIASEVIGLWPAAVFGLAFAFASPAWSSASRALWQHGPSMMWLSLTLWLLVQAQKRADLIQLCGFTLAFAYITRPTNSIALAIVSLYILVRYPRFIVPYLGWAALVLFPFVMSNLDNYGRLLPIYYQAKRLTMTGTFVQALAANLVSPNRGLFVFCPVLLFGMVELTKRLWARSVSELEFVLLVVVTLHWIAISLFPVWWAGHSFGPRFFSDMLPFMFYLTLPIFKLASNLKPSQASLRYSILSICILIGGLINYRGATSVSAQTWNRVPANIDSHTERVWDWRDPQFLRGL